MSKISTSEALDDNPPITQADIDNGRLILRQRKKGQVLPLKQRVDIYLDREIVEHFKQRAGGRGYQTLSQRSLKTGYPARSSRRYAQARHSRRIGRPNTLSGTF